MSVGAARPHEAVCVCAPEVLEYLRTHRDDFVHLLQELVEVESPSSDADAQGPMHEVLARALGTVGYAGRRVRGASSGPHLFARPRQRERGQPVQLLVGHYDTVWPTGTLDRLPFRVEDGIVRGPGSFDMKAGLTQMVLALRAIRDLKLPCPVTPVIFVNSDEEIGSRDSGRWIRRLARDADRALVLEPALGPDGALKTARKGIGRFTVTVHGRAAHAGLDPEAGASAILELSHVIQQLFALNDRERGATVNVGTIDGGIQPNVVAPKSQAVVDVRVAHAADGERITEAIHALKPATPGVKLEIDGGIGRPAMEATPRNRALWLLARQRAAQLGLELEEAAAGGGSDGNTTSQYTATLDGLGAVGDGAHAEHEFLDLERSIERAALLVLLLTAPPLAATINPSED